MYDYYNRKIDYLRVSITDRCNLRCQYCNPHSFLPKLSHKDILSYEEILRIIRVGTELGISKVRITGGEPLVRKGVYKFIKKVTQVKGITDVSLTTNGVLLKENIHKIKESDIKRINISLDTLNRNKYKFITGFDYFNQVREGIESAYQYGFNPIKINVVLMRNINDNELKDFAQLSLLYPFQIRFIEYMPFGTAINGKDWYISTVEIKKRIKRAGELFELPVDDECGHVKRYRFENGKGEIGFISPISNHFCDKCNRIRLTASGRLRPCLLSGNDIDIKSALRSNATDRELSDIFIKAVNAKPAGHGFGDGLAGEPACKGMVGIGG